MGRPLFSTLIEQTVRVAQPVEVVGDGPICERWSSTNPFDPDDDAFFNNEHAVYEAFLNEEEVRLRARSNATSVLQERHERLRELMRQRGGPVSTPQELAASEEFRDLLDAMQDGRERLASPTDGQSELRSLMRQSQTDLSPELFAQILIQRDNIPRMSSSEDNSRVPGVTVRTRMQPRAMRNISSRSSPAEVSSALAVSRDVSRSPQESLLHDEVDRLEERLASSVVEQRNSLPPFRSAFLEQSLRTPREDQLREMEESVRIVMEAQESARNREGVVQDSLEYQVQVEVERQRRMIARTEQDLEALHRNLRVNTTSARVQHRERSRRGNEHSASPVSSSRVMAPRMARSPVSPLPMVGVIPGVESIGLPLHTASAANTPPPLRISDSGMNLPGFDDIPGLLEVGGSSSEEDSDSVHTDSADAMSGRSSPEDLLSHRRPSRRVYRPVLLRGAVPQERRHEAPAAQVGEPWMDNDEMMNIVVSDSFESRSRSSSRQSSHPSLSEAQAESGLAREVAASEREDSNAHYDPLINSYLTQFAQSPPNNTSSAPIPIPIHNSSTPFLRNANASGTPGATSGMNMTPPPSVTPRFLTWGAHASPSAAGPTRGPFNSIYSSPSSPLRRVRRSSGTPVVVFRNTGSGNSPF